MRRILVDYARSRSAAKRGDGACRVTLDENLVALEERDLEVVALDNALTKLGKEDRLSAKQNCGAAVFCGVVNRGPPKLCTSLRLR